MPQFFFYQTLFLSWDDPRIPILYLKGKQLIAITHPVQIDQRELLLFWNILRHVVHVAKICYLPPNVFFFLGQTKSMKFPPATFPT